jgi:hypothetical protein
MKASIQMASETAQRDFTIETWAARMLGRALLAIALTAAVAYLVDWAIWRARVAGGGGIGQVEVKLFIVGELKGGKEDYYPQGSSIMPCSKTLYPQGGDQPCWWLERHREQIQRY